MAHGYPDYGISAPVATIYPIIDAGELAVRLGSIDTQDRRGNVIWLDTFEDGVEKWYHIPAVGASFKWSAENPYQGGFSGRLQTDDIAVEEAEVEITRPYPVLSKMGFELAFSYNQYLTHIQLSTYLADGTNMHRAKVRWSQATKTWEYRDDGYVWRSLAPVANFPSGLANFAIVKLVVDYVAQEYVRLIANNITYDLSGKGYSKTNSVSGPYIYFNILIETNANFSAVLHLGSFILTTNEP